MPIGIQWGEIANRLRRSFDARGRIPLQLDETVVPVAIASYSADLPYALDPALAAGETEVAAILGVQGTIGITNQGPQGSVFMLDELWLSNSVAGSRIEVSRSGVLQVDGTFTDKDLADMSTSCLGLATALRVPVRLRAWTVAPAATGGAIAQILRVLTTDQPYQVKAMLRRGEVIYVKNLSTNQEIHVSCAGRFFTQLASDVGP